MDKTETPVFRQFTRSSVWRQAHLRFRCPQMPRLQAGF